MKTKRILVLALAAVLSLGVLLTGCSTQNDNQDVITIKVGTQGMPAPFVYADENNELQGYDIEVLKAVFAKLPQYKLEFEITDISSVFTGISSGTYQLGVGDYGFNEERSKTYNYSLPYDITSSVFVTSPGHEIKSLEDAAGLTFECSVGEKIGETIIEWNKSHPGKEINVQYVDSSATVLQDAVAGKIDFMICDKASYYAYSKSLPIEMVVSEIPEEEQELLYASYTTHFVLPKTEESDALLEEINAALRELEAEGVLKQLSETVFGWDQSPKAADFDAFEERLDSLNNN